MVKTVRAYARSEAGVLGPQGISETVLQAMGQTERHRFTPGRSCSLAYMGRAGTHWPGPNNIAAVHSRADDPFRGSQIRPYRPGSWHWSGYQAAILARLVRKVCTV